jgi:hypothetical protein
MITIRPALPSELDVLNAIDNDATTLYAQHGLRIELAPDHIFVLNEQARWLSASELERAFLAVEGAPLACPDPSRGDAMPALIASLANWTHICVAADARSLTLN